jgi:hypothetical protein
VQSARGPFFKTKTVLFGVQDSTFGPYLTAMHRNPYSSPSPLRLARARAKNRTFGPYLAAIHRNPYSSPIPLRLARARKESPSHFVRSMRNGLGNGAQSSNWCAQVRRCHEPNRKNPKPNGFLAGNPPTNALAVLRVCIFPSSPLPKQNKITPPPKPPAFDLPISSRKHPATAAWTRRPPAGAALPYLLLLFKLCTLCCLLLSDPLLLLLLQRQQLRQQRPDSIQHGRVTATEQVTPSTAQRSTAHGAHTSKGAAKHFRTLSLPEGGWSACEAGLLAPPGAPRRAGERSPSPPAWAGSAL